jgi:hypothetical protein
MGGRDIVEKGGEVGMKAWPRGEGGPATSFRPPIALILLHVTCFLSIHMNIHAERTVIQTGKKYHLSMIVAILHMYLSGNWFLRCGSLSNGNLYSVLVHM